tara:strand:+ start:2036 stop:2689 length:654 start_codon:yes stop_codon:yes gene_type:complete
MNLENYYYYFRAALSPKLCDDIIKHCSLQLEPALIGNESEIKQFRKADGKIQNTTLEKMQKKRVSDVSFFDDRWIYKEIQPYVNLANRLTNWNFDWDWTEQMQFTKYGLNQHYNWHCDSYPKPYIDVPDGMKGKIRKLSVTVSLSDPDDYDGGGLEFDLRNTHDYEWNEKKSKTVCQEIKYKGSVVVFPSFVWHRVTPVTRGTRYSLVMWNLGQPWK